VSAPVDAHALVGTWQAVEWTIAYPDGRTTRPFGADLDGRLLYAADGGMSALIAAGGRAPLPPGNPRDAAPEARAALFDSCLAYAGRWRLEAGRVRHEVAVSLNPVLIDTVQWREPELHGDRLDLVARETLPDGGTRVHRLGWRRVPA
jgi:hypothetical protein